MTASSQQLKSWIHVIIAAVVCVASILLALPRDAKFGYEYNLGQPWHYAPLIATYEFPIYKSQAQLKAERDSAFQAFYPYFKVENTVGGRQIKNFKADYHKGKFSGVPDSYVNQAIKSLEQVYASGVVELKMMNRLTEWKAKGIRVVSNTNAVPQATATIFSPRTAYEYLMQNEDFEREIMSRLNLHDYIVPNLTYDSLKTVEGIAEVQSGISLHTGMVLAGERIIDRGERVSQHQLLILDSLRQESERRKENNSEKLLLLLGQFGMVLGVVVALLFYFRMFRRDLFESPHVIYLTFTLLTAFPVLTSLLVTYKFFSVFIIPFTMVTIIARVFLDTRTAFTTTVATIILSSIPLHTNYQFVVIQILAGLTAIYCIKELTERSQLLVTALIITVCTWGYGFFFDLAQGATLDNLDHSWYWYIGVNGVLLLFTYPLLYLIERLFGFTSSVTLIEMSNINTPLIRRMAREAQGTFVHSMQVGNLAAEVAAKIGAKVQLVRTGALYHDIGKMLNPAYFTENQGGGVNKHDELSAKDKEEVSAQIIISHVTEGMRLAEKHHIPKVVRDFIDTHHGNSLVKYFYINACNKRGAENVNPADFTYPGRNPFTREQAILMMADSIEASSRSLKTYTEENIKELVDKIIDTQVSEGRFKECPITFRDIMVAKETFAESLKILYHTRISYPDGKKPELPSEQPETKPRFFGNGWTWKR